MTIQVIPHVLSMRGGSISRNTPKWMHESWLKCNVLFSIFQILPVCCTSIHPFAESMGLMWNVAHYLPTFSVQCCTLFTNIFCPMLHTIYQHFLSNVAHYLLTFSVQCCTLFTNIFCPMLHTIYQHFLSNVAHYLPTFSVQCCTLFTNIFCPMLHTIYQHFLSNVAHYLPTFSVQCCTLFTNIFCPMLHTIYQHFLSNVAHYLPTFSVQCCTLFTNMFCPQLPSSDLVSMATFVEGRASLPGTLCHWWLSQPNYHLDPVLTHWGWDKMATISQTTLPNAFSWMKILRYRLKFHWCLVLRVQLMIFQHWLR